jgi:alpha-glucosidase
MLDVMRFWLDKGVDGFRVDVIYHVNQGRRLAQQPAQPRLPARHATYDQQIPAYSTDQPEVHQIVSMMRAVMDEYNERVMIGEIYLPIHKLVTYYGADNRGATCPLTSS